MATGTSIFAGYAAAFRGLVPELLQVSIHDTEGQPVWMSADYLRPEDQALVTAALEACAVGRSDRDYVVRDDARILAAFDLRAPHGATRGVALLELNAVPREGWPMSRLGARLEALCTCLGFELEERPAEESDAVMTRGAGSINRPAGDAALLAQLGEALREKRFELYLQPILPLRAELELLRFEVLLRVRTEAGALLPPSAFLAAAARHGLMTDIDRAVLGTLLDWLTTHRRRWLRVPSVFAVNVAGESLADPAFLDFLESRISASGVPPQALCIEISVDSALAAAGEIGPAARRLESLGCTVAIDDFGRRDLAYGSLWACPAQYLKIDRLLVGAAHRDRVAGAVVSGIVRMAQMLGAKTIAESIESEDELAAMRALGVDFAQGFLLGAPAALQGMDFSAARHAALEQLNAVRH